MTPKRRGAAVARAGAKAGIMASRNGKLMAPPRTFRAVRRESDFLVTNICNSLTFLFGSHSHLERCATHNTHHNAREAISIRSGSPHNSTHSGHVVVVHAPAYSIGQQLFGHSAGEQFGLLDQRGAQLHHAVYF